MADRDALILFCWIAIFLLLFFECFYRKLKARVNRDVQPPPSPPQRCRSRRSESTRFTPPLFHCSKEAQIRIQMDEEPPPTYEEALSYAALINKFHISPYGDTVAGDNTPVTPQDDQRQQQRDGTQLDLNNNDDNNMDASEKLLPKETPVVDDDTAETQQPPPPTIPQNAANTHF